MKRKGCDCEKVHDGKHMMGGYKMIPQMIYYGLVGIMLYKKMLVKHMYFQLALISQCLASSLS